MTEQLNALRGQIEAKLAQIADLAALEGLRVGILGKKGELTAMLKQLGTLAPEERKAAGQAANELRDYAAGLIDAAKVRLAGAALQASIAEEKLDITLPGTRRTVGRMHPVSATYARLEALFAALGFDIVEGPHIESVLHNFDMLNTPPTHPSRDEADTFYIDESHVLRTHTSPMQVRTMLSQKPPIRIVVPGKVFRCDEVDATHTPVFHQMEGLVIDKGITFGDLRGMLEVIVRYVFGSDMKIRLRPSYFPFTEPSAEVDITCYACRGNSADCRVCKGSGWLELWGCGMVHPRVLEMAGIDPECYSGYAFGLGIDRITSAIHGITEPRFYFENDMQFLNRFTGVGA
jgi:phenylalanyl-tRNA synthetase alpha chain